MEYYQEVLLKKGVKCLQEYASKRKNITSLKVIGQELADIRDTQNAHQMLLRWYDLTVSSIENDRRYDDIIERFRAMQEERRFGLCFIALKESKQTKAERRKLKEEMEAYAQEYYERSLIQKSMHQIKVFTSETSEEYNVFEGQ